MSCYASHFNMLRWKDGLSERIMQDMNIYIGLYMYVCIYKFVMFNKDGYRGKWGLVWLKYLDMYSDKGGEGDELNSQPREVYDENKVMESGGRQRQSRAYPSQRKPSQ